MLNELIKDIHENAVNHGWWDDEKTVGEVIALCHSELSEALEEYRNKRPMMYVVGYNGEFITDEDKFNGRKPEGVAIELVDCVIRILDYCGKEKIDIDLYIDDRYSKGSKLTYETFGDFIAICHGYFTVSYRARANGECANPCGLADCCIAIQKYLEDCYLDMEVLIKMKHDYNKTRPYKHGGKVI